MVVVLLLNILSVAVVIVVAVVVGDAGAVFVDVACFFCLSIAVCLAHSFKVDRLDEDAWMFKKLPF